MGLSNVAVSRLALTWEVSCGWDSAVTFASGMETEAHRELSRTSTHAGVTMGKVGPSEGDDLSPFSSYLR